MHTAIRTLSIPGVIAAAALALVPALPAHALGLGIEFGSGVNKTETRNVGSFSRIEASGATELEITAGQTATVVTVSGDDNMVPLVKTTVSGNVLIIKTDNVENTKLPLVVKIGMPKLAAIEAFGASKISAVNLTGQRFELVGSGSTKATIGGTVDNLVIKLSGAGRVDAGGLAAREAEIRSSGASTVEVNASDKLSVHISGAGKVTYLGHPAITQHISGAGNIAAK
jgi:hypothetical protein